MSLHDRMEHADLLVVAVHGSTPALSNAVNELAIETRKPLVYATDDGESGEITLVDPQRSSCLVCRDLRRNLTSDFALEDHLFTVNAHETGSWLPSQVPAGESVVAAALIAAHVVGEVVRYVGAAAPLVFVNASLKIDLLSGVSRLHPVLRVPRCPACSNASLSCGLEVRRGRRW